MSSHHQNSEPFNFINWGLIDYQECEAKQLALLDEIHQTESPGALVLCSHPEVVTLGRSSEASDIINWTGPTYEVNRGGRATYHGPEQIVVYCLINLKFPGAQRKAKDIPDLLRCIEKSCIELLAQLGMQAEGKSKTDSDLNDTGVWVSGKKIMSLGIAVRHWVSYHGLAFNYENNPNAFAGINPCGFHQSKMTSLQSLADRLPTRSEIENNLCLNLAKNLF